MRKSKFLILLLLGILNCGLLGYIAYTSTSILTITAKEQSVKQQKPNTELKESIITTFN